MGAPGRHQDSPLVWRLFVLTSIESKCALDRRSEMIRLGEALGLVVLR